MRPPELAQLMAQLLAQADTVPGLADVLARIAGHPAQKINKLMPWNWRNPNSVHDAMAA